ncbi:RNA pyrophosphohydrolase [Helicobacter jaachi]|uniref:RNA pyrophosphohydrolase n=1 Tax=Helicobacter jaachi TaxID=1677920 RepID=A0A4U8TBT2_9HELI|nr:RNA pyrophosphohydrolase [Helicobacter jaachi]TLD97379.1 RNA pyrophosphohydrolase [Helicobacter jaachi]
MNDTPKKYRPNVAAVILSSVYPRECRFFIAHRLDIKGAWQFPQGGIDAGESPKDALLRELKEEIGTNEIQIISECPEWIQYDFPKGVTKKMYAGFAGQVQKYFLVRLKNDKAVNIQTPEPEFDKYEFVDTKELFERVTHFKKEVYKRVLGHFRKEGYI